MSPIRPEARNRPWIPKKENKPHQGRESRTKLYDTTRWRKVRALHLVANPLCVECTKEGKVKEATVLDHILRVNAGGSFWDGSNHQGLCNHHHQVKSANERHGKV